MVDAYVIDFKVPLSNTSSKIIKVLIQLHPTNSVMLYFYYTIENIF